ncbi:MAG: histidine kinase, partial [Myxococcales bacterium]|nr:histidine kinase [Myxococcales bacterium]
MMETATPTHASSFAAALLAALREAWWIYVLVPPLLTVVNLVGGGHSPSLLDALTVNVSATLCIGVSTQTAFVIAERRGWRLPWGLHLPLLVIVGVAVGTELMLLLLSLFARFDPAAVRRGAWLLGGVVAAVSAAISITYDRLRARARAIELREEQARRQALQARIDALQSRMNPHFLFNCLNTVAALIEEDPPAAVRAVEQLAELLRYTLEYGDETLVPLTDELRCVDEYLALERARFGERLRVDLRIAEDLAAVKVPPLTIQPLIENAIKHGVAPSRTPVTVTMTVRGDAE